MTQLSSQPRPSRPTDLLDPEFMHKIERLDVVSRKILLGKLQGERRSKRRGQSVEFADYRQYVSGDDLRKLDWNLYARLDRLFIRLFMEEEDLSLSILFDVTRSMDYGEPRKLDYAKRLAAALGYIGLVNYNRVSLMSFTDTVAGHLPNLRGRRPIPQMLEFIMAQDTPAPDARGAAAPGNLAAACKRFALTQTTRGVVVLVSDFLDKGDVAAALRYLAGERFDAFAIQILAPQEVEPEKGGVIGDLRLRDVEDGDLAEVSVSGALLQRYKANLQAYCAHIRDLCARRDITYLMSGTEVPFDALVLRYLREKGLVG